MTNESDAVPRNGAAGDPPPAGDREAHPRRPGADPLLGVRTADIEPYTGLGYLSKLFRMIAVIILLLLVAEVITGLYTQGREALWTLLPEVSRLVVFAALLWGVGDLAILLIDVGHDVRAARILLGRQTSHHLAQGSPRERAARSDDRSADGVEVRSEMDAR